MSKVILGRSRPILGALVILAGLMSLPYALEASGELTGTYKACKVNSGICRTVKVSSCRKVANGYRCTIRPI